MTSATQSSPSSFRATPVFAAFRVHGQGTQVAAQVAAPGGGRRPFGEWAAKVQPLLNHQNRQWLRTEYATAVRRAHDEADWARFREDADLYPNLEWVPSTSARPGADHRPYWGTVLPLSDPARHRPGDRWNCKCDLRQTAAPPPQPGLTAPPGSAVLFSDDHAYFPSDCHLRALMMGALAAGRKRRRAVAPSCTECRAARRAIERLGDNARRARKAVNEKLRHDLDKWADETLPEAKVGKFDARRDVVRGIVVNKRTTREVFNKNARGGHLKEVLAALRDYRRWMEGMRLMRTEASTHHKDASFNVYETEHGGAVYEVKTKAERGQETLYTIKWMREKEDAH